MRYKIEYLPIMILIDKKLDINQFSLSSFAKSRTSLCTGRSKNFLSSSLAVVTFSDKLVVTEEYFGDYG